jgi:hypothetical protein
MLINNCVGRWSLLLTGLISALSNDRRGTAETGITILWGVTYFPHLAHYNDVNDYKLSVLCALERKVLYACIYEGEPPVLWLRAAFGGFGNNWSARGSPQQR